MAIISETETMEQLAPRQFRVVSAVSRQFYKDSAQVWQSIDAVPEETSPGVLQATRNAFQIEQNLADASWEWVFRGHTLRAKLVAMVWLNWVTKERQIAALPQSVTPIWSAGQDKVLWPGFFGAGIDLQWRYTRNGIKQEVIATPAGRAGLGAPPWGAADTAIAFVTELTLPTLDLIDDDGQEFDRVAPLETLKTLSMKVGPDVFARFTIDSAYIQNWQVMRKAGLLPKHPPFPVLRKRLVQENGKTFLIEGERVSVLNQALGSANTWVFDPSVDVAGDTRDAMWKGSTRPNNTDEELSWAGAGDPSDYFSNDSDNEDAAFAFAVTGPASGDTIDTCTMQAVVTNQSGSGNMDVEVRGGDTDNAAVFSASHTHNPTDHFGALTTANVIWTTTSGDNTSPSLVSILQEIVNRPGWSSGNFAAIVLIGSPMSGGDWRGFRDTIGGGDVATLTFTYTAAGGGLSIPVAQHHRRIQGVI